MLADHRIGEHIDVVAFARLLHLNGARAAVQLADGSYRGERQRVNESTLRRHLAGDVTLAFAVVEAKMARAIVIDVDASFPAIVPILRGRLHEIGGAQFVDGSFVTDGSSAGRGKLVVAIERVAPREAARRIALDLRQAVLASEPGHALRSSDLTAFPLNASGGVVRILGRNAKREGPIERAFSLHGEPITSFERIVPVTVHRLLTIVDGLGAGYPPYLRRWLAIPWCRAEGTDKHHRRISAMAREAIRLHPEEPRRVFDRWLAQVEANSPELDLPSAKTGDSRNPLHHSRERAWNYALQAKPSWVPLDVSGQPAGIGRLYRSLVGLVQNNGLRPDAFATDYESIAANLGVAKSAAFGLVQRAEKAGILVRRDRGSTHAPGQRGRPTLYGLIGVGETPEIVLARSMKVDPRRIRDARS